MAKLARPSEREEILSLASTSHSVFIPNHLASTPATSRTPTRERYAPTRASPPHRELCRDRGLNGGEHIFSRVSRPMLDDLRVRVSHPSTGIFRNVHVKIIKTNIFEDIHFIIVYLCHSFYKI